jgi:ACS family tartrate transporter-like MFS transporter
MNAPAARGETPLDSARRKAYLRLLPLTFVCYVIAYVDRANVSIAKLTMTQDLPGFDNAVIGFGAGIFFFGYFLLEIPGTLIVEKWSARKWIARIMITWGIVAAMTAAVKTPTHFYVVRFVLGLAEAGFFPGILVYLTHWFPSRDRARAFALFMTATPMAQIVSPKISNALLKIGTEEVVGGVTVHHPALWGLHGWQWIYIAWGIPAVALGVFVLYFMTDRPAAAKWLTAEERDALEAELAREKAARQVAKHMTVLQALFHPRVLMLAGVYFLVVVSVYGVDFFLPSILQRWYGLKFDTLTTLVILPPVVSLIGLVVIGWSSDRTRERRLHTAIPIIVGAFGLALTPWSQGNLALTIACFMVAFFGLKAFLPAFWSLPGLFLTEAAAAGSIGLINSVGNLGGMVGPLIVGKVEVVTGSFIVGLYALSVSMLLGGVLVLFLGLGRRQDAGSPSDEKVGQEGSAGDDRVAVKVHNALGAKDLLVDEELARGGAARLGEDGGGRVRDDLGLA